VTALETTVAPARRTGAPLALAAAVMWGSQFPVAKSLYGDLDPYTLTAIRFGLAAVALTAILAVVEGVGAVRFSGRGLRAATMGTLGIGVGVLLVYIGLEHAAASSASLIVATQPLITTLVLRVRDGVRITALTAATTLTAFAGVLLVISRGHPSTLWDGALGWGLLLVLAGQVGWVIYTIDAVAFEGWSPLRYTALTAVPGGIVVLTIAAIVAASGRTHPDGASVANDPWLLAYAVVGPATLAVLAYNAGRARLGSQGAALFMNLAPVTTFAIVIIQGYRPVPAELIGAAVTIAAVSAHNLLGARPVRMEPI
jgi:drug/metabolite transporter (DMT)-like permease